PGETLGPRAVVGAGGLSAAPPGGSRWAGRPLRHAQLPALRHRVLQRADGAWRAGRRSPQGRAGSIPDHAGRDGRARGRFLTHSSALGCGPGTIPAISGSSPSGTTRSARSFLRCSRRSSFSLRLSRRDSSFCLLFDLGCTRPPSPHTTKEPGLGKAGLVHTVPLALTRWGGRSRPAGPWGPS